MQIFYHFKHVVDKKVSMYQYFYQSCHIRGSYDKLTDIPWHNKGKMLLRMLNEHIMHSK